ncbi:UNVERIFIED_CONTAM: hypothetical protein FKN15_013074 [Acipenser sinensis]
MRTEGQWASFNPQANCVSVSWSSGSDVSELLCLYQNFGLSVLVRLKTFHSAVNKETAGKGLVHKSK